MTDYSMAIYGLIFVTVVITAGVVFVLRQPQISRPLKSKGTEFYW